jgi:hypothetical protein
MTQDDRLESIRAVKEAVEDELLERPGVVGVDIGYKQVAGRPTDELAIRLLVEQKWDVPADQRMPDAIQEVRTDVIQVGRIVFHQLPDTSRYNPLVGGSSIGTCGGAPGIGTLGMLVRDRNTGQMMALSNWHVLVAGTTGQFDVTQPGPGDGAGCPGDVIGQVSRSAINEYVDCAVSTLNPSARGFACRIEGIGYYNGPAVTAINNRVVKRGRTTGLTYGDVDSVDLTVKIEVAGLSRTFRHQIGIWRAAGVNAVWGNPGDSGSVVVGWPNYRNEVVGLHFAGSTGNPFFPDGAYGVANPIFPVLDQLNVEMCQPPKGKESKDKEKDREKLGIDLDILIMKEKDNDVQEFQSPLHQKVSTESQLMSEMQSPAPAVPTQARMAGPLEERLARLEAAVVELRHFISQADRPQQPDYQQDPHEG